VHERLDAPTVTNRPELANECGRVRSHHLEERFDRLEHARHAAEGQGRGAEPDDFAILRRLIAADDLDRIGGGVGMIEGRVERLEPPRKICTATPGVD